MADRMLARTAVGALLVGLWGALVLAPPTGHGQGAARHTEATPARPALPTLSWPPDAFNGEPDAPRLDRLRQGHIVKIKPGGGGRSLGFKLYFADGTKAYFKPHQAFTGTNWYAEVAAYHLDRMLGMGRVPPVTAHRMAWEPLRRVAAQDRRLGEVHVDADGTVIGALVFWLPQKLRPLVTPAGWENWLRVEPYVRWSVTPYQRASAYAAGLQARKARGRAGEPAATYYESEPELTDPELPAALSDMLVLDFLTLNIDRWGGDNANVLVHGDTSPELIFLDNAAGFSQGPHRRSLMDSRLAPVQRFRRRTVDALRRLSLPELTRRLGASIGAPILDAHLLEGLAVRRTAVLEHIEALIEEHGEEAVLAWP